MQKLSARLKAVASLVRQGALVADIGCDHGLVAVYLVKNDISPFVTAVDIRQKPLDRCRLTVDKYGLCDKISCVLSDGLENVKEDCADDIIIAGMGGELIAEILSKCSYVSKKHLVLNPMTHPELLRRRLYDNGFEIENDIIVDDGSRQYCVFDAHYTGIFSDYSDADCFLGKTPDFSKKEYYVHLLNYLESKQKGGSDFSDLINLIKSNI